MNPHHSEIRSSSGQPESFRALNSRRFVRNSPSQVNTSAPPESEPESLTEKMNRKEVIPSAEVTVNVSPKDIAKLLECPVCYNICLPPIILCARGHFVCAVCQRILKECPLCRGGFTEVKNHLAEELARRCTLCCRHRDNGCLQSLPCDEMTQHLEHCDYRPQLCWSCDKLVDYKQFIPHLRQHNLEMDVYNKENNYLAAGFHIKDGLPVVEGSDTHYWDPIWFVRNDDQHFFCFLDFFASQYWFWMCLLGPKVACENLKWSMKLINGNPLKNVKITREYLGPVLPLQTPREEIFESGMCFPVDEVDLEEFMYRDGVDLVIKIIG